MLRPALSRHITESLAPWLFHHWTDDLKDFNLVRQYDPCGRTLLDMHVSEEMITGRKLFLAQEYDLSICRRTQWLRVQSRMFRQRLDNWWIPKLAKDRVRTIDAAPAGALSADILASCSVRA